MTPLRDSLIASFGARYMQGWYASLQPDTRALAEYAGRGMQASIVVAPGRMVDSVEKELASYRRNDNAGTPVARGKLPIVIVAVANDFTSAPPDWGIRHTATPTLVSVPGDPLERILRLRTSWQEYRTQIAFIAPEPGTAQSLAMQFHVFVSALENRRFSVQYPVIGLPVEVPCVIENPDIIAPSGDVNEDRITVLACDLNLRVLVPLVSGARPNEPNDGKGAGTFDDPHGLVGDFGVGVISSALASLVPNDADRTLL